MVNHYAKRETELPLWKRVAAWFGLLFLLALMVFFSWIPAHAQGGVCRVEAKNSGIDFCDKVNQALASNCDDIDIRNYVGTASCPFTSMVISKSATIRFGNINVFFPGTGIVIPVGVNNVSLKGITPFGTAANGSAGSGTVFTYTGTTGALITVGDNTGDTSNFNLEDITLGITGAGTSAIGLQLNRSINYTLIRPRIIGQIPSSTQKLIDLEGGASFTGGLILFPYLSNGNIAIFGSNAANANVVIGGQIPGVTANSATGISIGGNGNYILGPDVEGWSIGVRFTGATAIDNWVTTRFETNTVDVQADAGAAKNYAMTDDPANVIVDNSGNATNSLFAGHTRIDGRGTFSASFASFTATTNRQGLFIPDRAIVVTKITAALPTPVAGCTTSPTVSVTDGTSTVSLVIGNGVDGVISGTLNQAFAAGASVKIFLNPVGGGCTTSGQGTVTVQYRMQ